VNQESDVLLLESILVSRLLNIIPYSFYPFPRKLVSLHGLGETSQYLWLTVHLQLIFLTENKKFINFFTLKIYCVLQ